MIRYSQVRGQRVLAQQDAQLLGSVQRLLLDPASMSVSGAQLEGVVGEATILPWRAVVSVGPDALMVESADVLETPGTELEQRIGEGFFDLEGKQVLNDQGDSLGRLEDIEFDERSGRVTQLQVPGHRLPLQRIVAVGPTAVIIPAAAQ
ncbi:MAG TPA: PRC-barrel domain-containing protein [Candidatus Limnocylindria bacterium]|nr:PRC-barrel domain-containing protein [Candidatus Limnocylindria bacterium]